MEAVWLVVQDTPLRRVVASATNGLFPPATPRCFRSLTVPPCTEDVLWHVMEEPMPVSADDVTAFRAAWTVDGVSSNNRRLQRVNGRLVRRYGAEDGVTTAPEDLHATWLEAIGVPLEEGGLSGAGVALLVLAVVAGLAAAGLGLALCLVCRRVDKATPHRADASSSLASYSYYSGDF